MKEPWSIAMPRFLQMVSPMANAINSIGPGIKCHRMTIIKERILRNLVEE